jgi:peptidylprolyl isomerase
MPFNDGDFLLVEYTVRVKETGNIVDTTSEEIAKSENIYESGRLYGPVLVVLGKKWLNEMVEEELKKTDVGVEKEIIVPPEKAFGPRDPGKVKVYSLREFRRRNINVRLGDIVEIGGNRGIVKSISGGRVTVDFNHPLAGKTLIFKVKVVAKLEDFKDKIKALATRHLQIPMSEVGVDYDEEKKELTITIPSKYIAKKNLQYGKISLAADIHSFFKAIYLNNAISC